MKTAKTFFIKQCRLYQTIQMWAYPTYNIIMLLT